MVNINNFLTNAWNYIQTNLAVAIIYLLVGFIIAYLLGRILRKVLKEIEFDNIIFKTLGLKLNLEKRISNLVTYILYFVAIIIALTELLIGYYILIGIVMLISLILLISLLLMIIDFVPDLISGIIIKNKLKIGSSLSYDGINGKIKDITLTNTIVKVSNNNDNFFIPNRTIKKDLKHILIKN